MIRINLLWIVRKFCWVFIYLAQLSYANLLEVVQIEPISGGYAVIRAEPGSIVYFMDRSFSVDEDGFAAIGFGREVAGLHEINVLSTEGASSVKSVWIEARNYRVQRVNGVDSSRVTPPKSLTDRIVKEAKLVTSARATQSSLINWRIEPFHWPVKGPITGVYGSERIYNGVPKSPHWGVDMAAPKGTQVKAPVGGLVVLAENDLYYSGGTIVIDHGGGLTSSFLHLSAVNVRVGQIVNKGDTIAAVGSTGRSTGPHLDWRMNLHGERIDAALWVSESN
jgi:murein DD-endopeptidase MepM/ murein hydrolase activator NlpD